MDFVAFSMPCASPLMKRKACELERQNIVGMVAEPRFRQVSAARSRRPSTAGRGLPQARVPRRTRRATAQRARLFRWRRAAAIVSRRAGLTAQNPRNMHAAVSVGSMREPRREISPPAVDARERSRPRSRMPQRTARCLWNVRLRTGRRSWRVLLCDANVLAPRVCGISQACDRVSPAAHNCVNRRKSDVDGRDLSCRLGGSRHGRLPC